MSVKLAWALAAFLAFCSAVLAITTLAGSGRLTLEELRRGHALPDSSFVRLAGMDIHVVEEGSGPLLVLVHGHKNSLRLWDDWAAELREDYRVVRFDMPWYGLSGPGRNRESGVVDTYTVLKELLERHADSRAVLVGTANGGPPVAWYTHFHSERVAALALINTPFEPPAAVRRGSDLRAWLEREIFEVYGRPRWATRWFLRSVVKDPARRSPVLLEWTHDLNRRVGPDNVLSAYGTSTRFPDLQLNTEGLTSIQVLASLAQPVLIQWSGAGYLDPAVGESLLARLTNAELHRYEDAGHWLPVDRPRDTLDDFQRFLQTHEFHGHGASERPAAGSNPVADSGPRSHAHKDPSRVGGRT